MNNYINFIKNIFSKYNCIPLLFEYNQNSNLKIVSLVTKGLVKTSSEVKSIFYNYELVDRDRKDDAYNSYKTYFLPLKNNYIKYRKNYETSPRENQFIMVLKNKRN